VATVPRILIIDEDLDSRVEARKAVIRARLEVAGEVGFGTEAVSFATEYRPDAILVAVEEPVLRPLETAEALQNVLPETPVIFYASSNDPEAVRRAVLYGARDYLTKPLQSNTLHQAITRALAFEEKRQMRRAGQLAGTGVRGTVIVVTGAKGGIGKSVLAVNLALALRRQTLNKVVIIDADTQFGDVATLLDVTPHVTVGDLLASMDKVDRWNVSDYLTPAPEGLLVLAENHERAEWEDATPEDARKVVDMLAQTNEFVVIDTAGAMDRFVRQLVEASSLVLLVTTGEVSSVRDTKAALKRLDTWNVPREKVKLVYNRGARADGARVSDIEATFEQPLFWELPRDSAVPRSVQLGQPMVIDNPKARAAQSIAALATAIGGSLHSNGETTRLPLLGGLLRRNRQ
jgi:pilus assembly protein CpaE